MPLYALLLLLSMKQQGAPALPNACDLMDEDLARNVPRHNQCWLSMGTDRMPNECSAPRPRAPATLTIRSTPGPAEIRVNGTPAGWSPLRVRVESGPQIVEATVPGYGVVERCVMVRPTEDARIDLTMGPRVR